MSPINTTAPKRRPHHNNHGIRGLASSTRVFRSDVSTVNWPKNSPVTLDASPGGWLPRTRYICVMAARAVSLVASAALLLGPFRTLGRRRVLAQQFPHLCLLRDRHGDGLSVHRRQRRRLVSD